MTNNLRTLQLGAPSSIEGGASPNATLSVQVMERCTNISLHDGDDGTKCTTEGAPLAFGKLIRQREIEEVSTQTWYTPEDKQPVHINVSGESTMPKADWQQSYEMVDAINKTELTEDSVFAGTLNVPIASPSKVSAFNDWAANHGGGAIVPDATVQQFEDPEVARVLAEKVGGGSIITPTQMANITSISNWFNGNTQIESFNELKDTKVTSLNAAFTDCTQLREVDVSKIVSLKEPHIFMHTKIKHLLFYNCTTFNANELFFGISCAVYAPKIASVSTPLRGNNGAYFFPNATVAGSFFCYGGELSTVELIDFGDKLGSITPNDFNGFYLLHLVVRTNGFVPMNASWGRGLTAAKIFVDNNYIDDYKSASNWSTHSSRIYGIGSSDWKTYMRSLAEKCAAEYAGWSAEQIASANYADPYIDYDIFGVPRPTE